jgi:hypothetical protein
LHLFGRSTGKRIGVFVCRGESRLRQFGKEEVVKEERRGEERKLKKVLEERWSFSYHRRRFVMMMFF